MTDLEITKACAEAMEYKYIVEFSFPDSPVRKVGVTTTTGMGILYHPLHDDAQAMELVKKFNLYVYPRGSEPNKYTEWQVSRWDGVTGWGVELNRAICECVANMQEKK